MRDHSSMKRYVGGILALAMSLVSPGINWAQPSSLKTTSNQPVSDILAELEILNAKVETLQEVVDKVSKEMESQRDMRNVDKPVDFNDENIRVQQEVCDLNYGRCLGVESEVYENEK